MPGRGDQAGHRAGLEKWLALNAEYAKIWPNITVKKAPPADLRSGRGSRVNSIISHLFPAQAIEADSRWSLRRRNGR